MFDYSYDFLNIFGKKCIKMPTVLLLLSWTIREGGEDAARKCR